MANPRPPLRLLLEVWREACRHLEITESVGRLAPLLAEALPLERVLIRRVDLERGRGETVGDGALRPGASLASRSEWDEGQIDLVRAFAAAGKARAWSGTDALRSALAPEGLSGPLIVGPLASGDGRIGLLVVQGRRPLDGHVDFVQELLEPIGVALENDTRLQEMARLREAVEAENRALLSRLQRHDLSDSIVGREAGLREVMERVDQVARTDAPVLILGETGSGKEVVARALHAGSRRAGGPFLRVNCGAIPSELVDSELFGHERGSFTGAIATRKGWFERADGGTLFLDELAELPAAAQVRLLRVLQDGSFERVGGQRTHTVDVRIVAATHRDMNSLIATGGFRQDLWYRVSVFPIRLPSLRERPEDIAPLARHFASRAGLRLHGWELRPSEGDLALLKAYPWPGNVRELAAVLERAAILGDGHGLDVRTALGVFPSAPPSRPSQAQVEPLEAAMVRHIEDALRRTGGKIEGPRGAASLLGVNPHTLRSRMRKLGMDWGRFRAV